MLIIPLADNNCDLIDVFHEHPIILIGGLFFIGPIYDFFKHLISFIRGEDLSFLKQEDAYKKGERFQCQLSDIQGVQIRKYYGDKLDTYVLSLMTAEGLIKVDKDSKLDDMMDLSEQLADFLNLSITLKK
ncbi:hypothetical protein [Flammeovirga sp. SJP92]|uniref:hypothetical protein n=1 Tax=Flammeovirga sp. SJP92 TaxID=1775430 RepID=UPI0012FC69EC|nr:hypothetical protein [Flammeovirga sp. SJP92]